jgi:dTDP-4-amino-4,6-dideoxygalactose transaminase
MGIKGEGKMNTNDSQIIDLFEKEVAKYAGSKYGVAVSSGTNGIFLSLELLKLNNELPKDFIM